MPLLRRTLGVERHRPSENFVLNKDSPQAQELVGWWPCTEGKGPAIGYINGYPRTKHLLGASGAGNSHWTATPWGNAVRCDADFDISLGDNPNLTITYPLTMVAYTIVDDPGADTYATRWTSRSGELIGLLEESSNATLTYYNFDANGWQWVGGPALTYGEFQIEVATLYGSGLVDAWTISATGGYAKASETRSRTKTSATIDDVKLGGDEAVSLRHIHGNLLDARIIQRRYRDEDVWELWKNPWDLYHTPRIMVPGFVAAVAANPKGPLGHPLHGPLGGPVG